MMWGISLTNSIQEYLQGRSRQISYPHQIATKKDHGSIHIRSQQRRLRKYWYFSNKFNLFLKYKFSKINPSLSRGIKWMLQSIFQQRNCYIFYIKGDVQLKKYRYWERASSTRKSSKSTLLWNAQSPHSFDPICRENLTFLIVFCFLIPWGIESGLSL